MTSQLEERMRGYLHRQVKSALHAASDAVRIVTEIGVWVRTQEHLISLCDSPACADCEARRSLLSSLADLLPAEATERRADVRGEVDPMTNGTRVTRGGDDDDRDLSFGTNDTAAGGTDSGN